MQKQTFSLPIAIVLVLTLVGLASAAVTLGGPAPLALSNYTTLTLNCSTTASGGVSGALNATFYYNASGGATGFKFGISAALCTVINESAEDRDFYTTDNSACATAFEALIDADNSPGYNFSCSIYNVTGNSNATNSVATVGIDNTLPTVTVTTDFSSVNLGRYFKYTTTLSDATSGLTGTTTTYCNITDAEGDVDKDGTISISASSTDFTNTHVAGTYTISCTATDTAGNTNSASAVVTAKTTGAPIITGVEDDLPTGFSNTQLLIGLGVIVFIGWLLTKKK